MKGILVGVPWDMKPVCLPWSFAKQSISPPMNYEVQWQIVPGKPVHEARNEIINYAYSKGVKYVMFLGTDTSGPAHGMRQLIFHLENFEEKGFAVAGGVYCHKSPPCMPMVFRGNGKGPYMDWKVGEVFEVSGIGMDWTIINLELLKDLPQPWFMTIDNIEKAKDGIHAYEAWTEDLYFCNKVSEAGFKILADGGLLCDHWDNMTATSYTMDKNAKPFTKLKELQKKTAGGKKIVDLGSGPASNSYRTDEGYVVRVDVRDDVKPDFRCDLRSLPFKTGDYDLVYSCHVLEHFKLSEISAVLDEWVRIMKPEGEMRLVLPNLEWAARHIVNREVDKDVMNVVYGEQNYIENFHRAGFTPDMIEGALKKKGFTRFLWDFNSYHMMVRAWKVEPAEVTIFRSIEDGSHVETIANVPATHPQLNWSGSGEIPASSIDLAKAASLEAGLKKIGVAPYPYDTSKPEVAKALGVEVDNVVAFKISDMKTSPEDSLVTMDDSLVELSEPEELTSRKQQEASGGVEEVEVTPG